MTVVEDKEYGKEERKKYGGDEGSAKLARERRRARATEIGNGRWRQAREAEERGS